MRKLIRASWRMPMGNRTARNGRQLWVIDQLILIPSGLRPWKVIKDPPGPAPVGSIFSRITTGVYTE
jgi:hypothetical protein